LNATAESPENDKPWRANPVFWLMWLLPASAVIGGLVTLAIAVRDADRALPAGYHWEGERLDRDFALARNAAAHGITVEFTLVAGECIARVRAAPRDARVLNLLFASGVDPGLDRVVLLQRAAPGEYRSACQPLPAGRWRIALEDDAREWAIRTQVAGSVERLTLRARNPDGG
jgi:hypothetical protein